MYWYYDGVNMISFVSQVPFSNVIYIEQTDFRMKDSKDYCGLAPGKVVLLRWHFLPFFFSGEQIKWIESCPKLIPILENEPISPLLLGVFKVECLIILHRYAFPIKCTEVVLSDDKKTVVEIHAEYDPDKKTKPKGVLHWVAEPSPGVPCTVVVLSLERERERRRERERD
ncbi:putative glutamine--tRNA ligase [Helianthus anomalus]